MTVSERVSLDAVTALIVNWNQPDYTIRSAQALISDGMPAKRVVVIDNGSQEDSWFRLTSELRSCHLVRIDENLGFARANNAGARVLPASAYLFVNNDTFVHHKGSVNALVRTLALPEVGIAVPRLLNEDLTLQPNVVPAMTPAVAFARASGLGRLVPNRWRASWSPRWDHALSCEIQSANAAVMLVRGELWDRLGGFRETSFMYAEDLDLCWRAREQGWRVWFTAEAEFVHVGRASTRWDARERAERVAEAEAVMLREHLSPLQARQALAFMRAGYAIRFAIRKLLGHRSAAEECVGFLRGYGAPADEGPIAAATPAPRIEVFPPKGST